MLKIRLRRPGKSVKKRHQFKIVVIDSRKPRDSRFVEQVGHYDPTRSVLEFNITKYENWIKKGVQPTDTVASLFKKYKKANQG